jgi:uncharacterized membrane protein
MEGEALIQNDAVVLGIMLVVLAGIFRAERSEHPLAQKVFTFVPGLLLCYFIPAVLGTLRIVDGDKSNLYFVSSRYLLPTCLVFLTLSIDLGAIAKLGKKAVIMFFTGTLGILLGGPLALLIMSAIFPEMLGVDGPDVVWRGMTTVAGSWIGGGANQTAMKEVYEVGDQIFSAMIAVDVICANVWMAILLFLAANPSRFDRVFGGDTSAIEAVKQRVMAFQAKTARIATLTDLMTLLAVGFAMTALGHVVADLIAPAIAEHAPWAARFSLTSKFFWLIVVATSAGLVLSFTKARDLEGVGASRIGSAFLYVLIASIGMKMDLTALVEAPKLFLLGLIWLSVHAALLLIVAKIIKAPLFFLAVGSQANVGGAASAPVVASAFHPSLAPVGVLLAVFGYALGTYAAWLCGQLLRVVAT